ncbi:MAG TPA: VOC family protein [Gemmatimonadales bacterium]|jgi:Glyoxalase/Bleomycin resistance protein/Dioxygenase superfamily.
MIFGAHLLLYSSDADADRAFLRDVLGFKAVDAGRGWLIFALPPAEVAVHPLEDEPAPAPAGSPLLPAALYLMCDNVRAYIYRLAERGVQCSALQEEHWGIVTTIPLPSGASLGLYQAKHPTALEIGTS